MINPFNIGKLYRFTKMKPAVVPIYIRTNNEWKGTALGITDGNVYKFNDISLLCIDSIYHDYVDMHVGYIGIFLAGDKIVGLSNTWVKEAI